MQREDFKGIFKEMRGLPVTVRLLDPPLHEFVPRQVYSFPAQVPTAGAARRVLPYRRGGAGGSGGRSPPTFRGMDLGLGGELVTRALPPELTLTK